MGASISGSESGGTAAPTLTRETGSYYLGETSSVSTLDPTTSAWAKLTFTASGATFNYTLTASNIKATTGTSVKFIYYPEPSGTGLRCIGTGTVSGGSLSLSGNININTNIPAATDSNFSSSRGKMRVVDASDVNCNTQLITASNPRYYLYEAADENIVYTDTNISNTLDTVDLGGDVTQELAHGVKPASGYADGTWSDAWRYDSNWGGGYGNGVALLKTLRLVQGRGDGYVSANNDGLMSFDVGADAASKIQVEHLDGSANDYFDVIVNGVTVGSYTGDATGGENWHDVAVNAPPNPAEFGATTFTINPPVTGTVTVNIYLTSPDAGTCAAWGQLGIDSVTMLKQ